MVTVTINKIDNVDVTNDIRCLTSDMIVNGSVRPSTVNTAGSACILSVLVWDGNILNYRAEEWLLTDTYTSIVASFNLVSVTLAKVDGATVTADLRGFDPKMMVAGSMRPLTANNTATAAVFRVLTWDNNTFTQKAVEWQVTSTYAALKTAIEAAERAANQYAPPYAAATGTDTYALTLVPAISAYTTGVPFHFSVANTNTGAATLNVSGLGAKTLVKGAGTALAANDLEVGKIYQGVYDGVEIQVSELPAVSASEWTTTTVAISSAELLACGGAQKELLPAPAANTYYEIENIRLEFDYGTVQYQSTTATHLVINDQGRVPSQTISVIKAFGGGGLIGGNDNAVVVLKPQSQSYYDAVNTFTFAEATSLGTGNVSLGTNDNDNPILGDGTMRAIIRYKVRTFGA